MPSIHLLFCATLLLWCSSIAATAQQAPKVAIRKATAAIQLDGKLTEADWQSADTATHFWQTLPTDTSAANSQTVVRLAYDRRYLYLSAVCYNSQPEGQYVLQSLKRDFSFPVNDAFVIMLDPFMNHTNGISFGVSAAGVQREGTVDNAGLGGVTTAFDTKWLSAVRNYGSYWVAEIAIPFRVLRYSNTGLQWGINFARNDLRANETSTWSAVSRQFNVAYLVQEGVLQWDSPPPPAGANVVVLPYASVSVANDASNAMATELRRPTTGIDAKVGITSSLNLDVTIHPDFAQVEVDAQVTNLDRFNLFFPERRNFFTENSDVFRFGNDRMQPFFSRAVGLAAPLLGGLRLTGSLDQRWRIGLMSMQTEGATPAKQSQNYTVATVQRRIGLNSNARIFGVRKQAFNANGTPNSNNHNTVWGAEMLYRSDNGKWSANALFHQTYTTTNGNHSPHTATERSGAELRTAYQGRNWYGLVTTEYMGEGYTAQAGFVQDLYQRNDQTAQFVAVPYGLSQHYVGYKMYPKHRNNWRSYGPEAGGKLTYSLLPNGKLDRYHYLNMSATTQNQSTYKIQLQYYATQLYYPTNITGRMTVLLAPNTYRYGNAGVEAETTRRNRFYGTFKAYYGDFFGGQRLNLSADATYRLQPWGNVSLNVAYNRIHFPSSYNSNTTLLLISPRVELTFTRSLFWTTFVQYNTQIENLNINTRLQWRFAPMSDLYVVLTDNMYAPDNFELHRIEPKNWGLVLKMSYWLGI